MPKKPCQYIIYQYATGDRHYDKFKAWQADNYLKYCREHHKTPRIRGKSQMPVIEDKDYMSFTNWLLARYWPDWQTH